MHIDDYLRGKKIKFRSDYRAVMLLNSRATRGMYRATATFVTMVLTGVFFMQMPFWQYNVSQHRVLVRRVCGWYMQV